MKIWILLTLAGLFILWGNPASSQPIIHVWGTADSLVVRNQVTQYLDYLEVEENIYVSVGFITELPENLLGITFCPNAPDTHVYLVIRVWIDSHLNKTQQRFALAHEMIHVKQYAKGELRMINNQQVMWKERKYNYQQADRRWSPWEQEAYRDDNFLVRLYKEQPETPMVARGKGQ